MGSGGPGLGRNPSKGENVRGLQGKTRQSQRLLASGQEGQLPHLPGYIGCEGKYPPRQGSPCHKAFPRWVGN